MQSFKISDDNGDLKQIFDFMNQNMSSSVLPNTAIALENTEKYAESKLNKYVQGIGELDGLEPIEKPFSPDKIRYGKQQSTFSISINAQNNELSKIQNGQSESWFDMKTKYPYGRKSRVARNEDGSVKSYYLIIPFRWGAGAKRAHFNSFIPEVEYNTMAKPMKMSKTLFELRYEENARGEMIPRATYDWKTRLKNTWSKEAEGMVRMKGVKGSTYFTFRVISTKSPASSWWRYTPNKPAVNIEQAWAKTVEPYFYRQVKKGILADLGVEKRQ